MRKINLYLVLAGIIIFSGAMLVLAHSGKNQKDLATVNPAFRAYVQAFTSGRVSTRTPIRVRLADDFADSVSLNMPLAAGYFKFSPAIHGKTYWSDSRTLEFLPDEKLPQDQVYTVEFYLSHLLTVPDSLKTMVFQFRTISQELSVSVDNHKAYSHSNLSKEHLYGTLQTSDVAGDPQVEEVLTATQGGRDLPVEWTHDQKKRTHFFQVDSIARTNEAGEVKLSWNGSPIDSKTTGNNIVEIPALGNFKVLSVGSFPDPQQCLRVQFSDPLKTDQNLDGLFRVGKYDNLRYNVEDNLLLIYLPETENKKVSLTLEPSIRNINQVVLGKRVVEQVPVDNTKPAVRFTGDGVILPSSNGMLLPFEAVNLNAVDIKVVRIFANNILQFLQVNELNDNSQLARVGRVVLKKTIPLNGVADYGKWNRYSIDLSTLMHTEPGAVYSVSLRFKKGYSTYPCADSDSLAAPQNDMVVDQDPETENDQNWDYYSSYEENDYRDGGWQKYRWEERDNPCKPSYYFNKSISRNVLASDLGIIAKTGSDGNYHVFVTDLISTKPLAGVSVEFFNFQLQGMGKTTTDGEGMVSVPMKKRPFILVAKSGSQTGYLKLTDGNALSLSMFDVSGEPVQKGLKGFIYGERGVWRPGDSVFLTFVLEDKMHQLPPHHPVSMSLFNPNGQLITRMVRTTSLNGFYNFSTATTYDAPTGNWLAKVNVGGVEFQKTLKIETVKPNRLKISFDFKAERLVKDKVPSALLEAAWLTGATAGNLKAKVMLTLSKSVTAFKNYPGYVFDNPTAGFAAENITVFDGKLDANGRTLVVPKIHVTNLAPGALKASFETMVFEDGGDFSVDRFTIPYYPYQSYAGLSVPKGRGGDQVLSTDKSYNIDLLNVDAQGQPVPANQLKVEVFKLEWRWWWDDSEAGSADFISTSYIRPSDSATVKTVHGKATYVFQAEYNNWGRYLIKVTDKTSGHAAGKVVYVDWPGYFRMPGGEKQAAAMLTLTTDKSQYKVGDKVRLTLPASPDGRALVTIETGSTILKSFWVPTSKGTTDVAFDATEAMSPNCYACVTLIQPHAQTKNDLPIRLYGVIPVPVENPGTHLKPVITMAKELEPGKVVTISIREAAGKPMTYTLAMVDDGLLDLTRFKTPDPWSVFYAREALGVKTWDLFDQVMGAFSGELQRILSIGGDQDLLNKGGLKANRFKPMVKFLGPFELKKGQSRVHSLVMPEYIGSVRVMVVAGQDGAYGRDEKTAAVKKPLMVLGTLPRVVGPGETVKLPVSVFSMDKSIKHVTVELVVSEMFSVSGGNTQQVTFNGTGDQLVSFDLNVAQAVGTGKVRIVATSGKLRAEHTMEIGVRNPNSRVTTVLEKAIQPGAMWTTDYRAPGVAGSNKGTLELSTTLPMNLEQRLSYLIQYPYGCVEQTVSSVFPQLYLADLIDLRASAKKETEQNIRAAIQRLKSFQQSNGGMAYWPGIQYSDDWGTSYAGHFLLEAEKKGFALPLTFLAAWKEYQRQKAVSWVYDASYYNDELMQAYRLFTLALAKSPELGAMNKLLEKRDLGIAARWQLAAAYQLAGKREVALQLVNKLPESVKPYRETGYTYGSDLRDKAIIADALCMMDLKTRAAPLVKEISASLCNDSWYSTQSTSFALMAVARFTGNTAGTGISASIRQNSDPPEEVTSAKPVLTSEINVVTGKKGVIQVTNRGKNILFARLILTGIPAQGDTTSAANGLKITMAFKSMKGDLLKPWVMGQGVNFIAEVTVTHPGLHGVYRQLALTQVFPSGWEIINARSSEYAQAGTASSAFDYQDVRDDRVNTFFDLDPGKSKTFRVLLMATYLGRFYLPSATCEAMYDNTISARVPGYWVEVVAAAK
ncbi:MAG: MG2 domain-containing protein [Bacteroidetes bacterium]|nr:MG2 domain-containing protein [Bacteroidota bacterium]